MARYTAAWKNHERRTAAALGGVRLGATGAANPDVDAGWLVVECKHRAKLPAWLTDALARIRGQAGADRLGIVVLHQSGARDSVVLLSLKDFTDWYGALPDGEEADSSPCPAR